MEPLLKDYRCACGKLLFKASLLLSPVEIKCRRCSSVMSFCDSPLVSESSLVVLTDPAGRITYAPQRVATLLGHTSESIKGQQISSLCPGIKQVLDLSHLAGVIFWQP